MHTLLLSVFFLFLLAFSFYIGLSIGYTEWYYHETEEAKKTRWGRFQKWLMETF